MEKGKFTAGYIEGGEDSTVLLLKGGDVEVKQAIKIIEKIKGEPPVIEPA